MTPVQLLALFILIVAWIGALISGGSVESAIFVAAFCIVLSIIEVTEQIVNGQKE